MRRDFAGHASFRALAAAHGFERVGGGKMRDMQARSANLLRQLNVAIDDAASAAAVMARRPRRKLRRPRVHRAFSVSRVSSACCTRENSVLRRGAGPSRIMSSSRMGLPSSVTATAPARCSGRKSVNAPPLLLRVAAAMGNTLTTAPRSGTAATSPNRRNRLPAGCWACNKRR